MAGSTVYKQTYEKSVNPALQVVPNSGTALTSEDTLLFSMYVSNTTGGAVTLLVVDGNSRQVIPTVSIPANTVQFYQWNDGIFCPGGITWTAGSASALHAAVTATYKDP